MIGMMVEGDMWVEGWYLVCMWVVGWYPVGLRVEGSYLIDNMIEGGMWVEGWYLIGMWVEGYYPGASRRQGLIHTQINTAHFDDGQEEPQKGRGAALRQVRRLAGAHRMQH